MQIVLIDTAQIQSYIFSSNRLGENIGASFLVDRATSDWVFDALPQPSNVSNYKLNEAARIEEESSDIVAEVAYAGGGNCVVLFREETDAREFSKRLSERILLEAPGLQILIHRQAFEWSQCLSKVIQEAMTTLQESKELRAVSNPLGSLGVTATCANTELPATKIIAGRGGQRAVLVDESAIAKLNPFPNETERLLEQKIPLPAGYLYPRDFDDLGRTHGEFSNIAVVHADGDGIGKRIMEIANRHSGTSQNRKYINEIRSFSSALNESATKALSGTLADLVACISEGRLLHVVNGTEMSRIDLKKEGNSFYLPFRPIVFGGDDVTFVCDARIGLALTSMYLKQFENVTAFMPPLGKSTASAGVAIVKSHYPFSRAYSLAEELCQSAKDFRKDKGISSSCMDWHFAQSGLTSSLEAIRRREYRVPAGDLTLRPVMLEAEVRSSVDGRLDPQVDVGLLRSWDCVKTTTMAFQNEEWQGRRNKVKSLRDALRDGPESVQWFNRKFNDDRGLPAIDGGGPNLTQTGWQGQLCPYFDAIELMDWYVPLSRN